MERQFLGAASGFRRPTGCVRFLKEVDEECNRMVLGAMLCRIQHLADCRDSIKAHRSADSGALLNMGRSGFLCEV